MKLYKYFHMFENITNQNCQLYAAKCYDSPNCIQSEFNDDYQKIKYVKRLVQKYRISGNLKERLILNHCICLANTFGVEAAVRLLFLKIDKKDYYILKTFLLTLNYLPDIIKGINGKNIMVATINIDPELQKKLQEI